METREGYERVKGGWDMPIDAEVDDDGYYWRPIVKPALPHKPSRLERLADSPLAGIALITAMALVFLGVLGLVLGLIRIGLRWLWEIVVDLLILMETVLKSLYALLVSLLDRT